MICPQCTEEFIPHSWRQLYCSRKCQVKHNHLTRGKPLPRIPCAVCGKEFQPVSRTARYCSQECKRRAQKKSDVPSGPGGPDREITELTVYLVHKYAAEGMMEPEIAGILKRSAASVHEAIERPLKPYQQRCLQTFLKGR